MEYSIFGENKPIHFSKELCALDELDCNDRKSHENWSREESMQSNGSIMTNQTFPVHLTQYHSDLMTLKNSHGKIEEKDQMKKTRKMRTMSEGSMSWKKFNRSPTSNSQHIKNSTKSNRNLKRSNSGNIMNHTTYHNDLNIIEENNKINIETNTDVSSFVKENHMQVEEITFAEEEVEIEKSEPKMNETNQPSIINTPLQDNLKGFTQKDIIDALYYDYILSNVMESIRNDILIEKQIENKMNDTHRKIINIFTLHAKKEDLKKLQKNIIFLITQQKYFYQKYIDITFPEDTENCYYIISKEWFQAFQNFLSGKNGEMGSYPGPITNSSLFVIDQSKLEMSKNKKKRIKLFRNQLKMELKEGKDYICINKYMWRYIQYMYTGSPCIKRKSNNLYGIPARFSKHDQMSQNILSLIEPAYMKNLCVRFNYNKMYRNEQVDVEDKTKIIKSEKQADDHQKTETPETNKEEKEKEEKEKEEEGSYAQNFKDLLEMYLLKKTQTEFEYVECDLINRKAENEQINMKSNVNGFKNSEEFNEMKEGNEDDSSSMLSSISSSESYLQNIINQRNNTYEKNKQEALSMSSNNTVTYLLGELCKNSYQGEFYNGSVSCTSLDKFYSCCEFRTSDEQTMICSKNNGSSPTDNSKMNSLTLNVTINEQGNSTSKTIPDKKCEEYTHQKDQSEKKEDNASIKNQNQDQIINQNGNNENYDDDNNDKKNNKNINNNNNNGKNNNNNEDDNNNDDNDEHKNENNNESTNENTEKRKKKKKKNPSEKNLIDDMNRKNNSSMNEMSDTENYIGYGVLTTASLKRNSKQEDIFATNDNFKSCNESMEEIARVSSNGYVTTVELETSTSDESSSYDGSIKMQNDITVRNGKETKGSFLKSFCTYQNSNVNTKREDNGKMMFHFFPKGSNSKEAKGKLKEKTEKKHNELTMNKSLHTRSVNLTHSLMDKLGKELKYRKEHVIEKKHEKEAALRKKRLNLLGNNKLGNSLDVRNNNNNNINNNNDTPEYSNLIDSFEYLENSVKNQADSSTRAQINSNKSTSASNGLDGDEELDQLDDSPRSNPQRGESILNLNNAKLLVGKEIPAGIINYSTTCYVNVVMQTLAGLYKLVNTMSDFVNTKYKHIGLSGDEMDNMHSPFMINKRFFTSSIAFNLFGNTTKRKDEKLLYTFSLKFSQLSKMYNKPKVLCANRLLGMLNEKYPDLFEFNEQQDCHEFLLLIFEFIHNMMKVVDESVSKNNQIEYHLKREQSIISEMFGGLIEARISCSQCEYVNYLYEPMYNLSVTFRKNNVEEDNLSQNLVEYFKREELHSTCEKCKCKIMYKDTYVYKQPNILIIHWIRLSENGTKIDAGFKYELDDFSLEPILKKKGLQCIEEPKKYRLYSVIVHRGVNSTCGHYICYTRRQHSNGLYMWYRFDDANVSIVSTEEVLSAKAYCLFYESK